MTIQQYYDVIIEEKNNQAIIKDELEPTSNQVENLENLLAELNSPSKVAIWRLFAFVIATVAWYIEQLQASYKTDLTQQTSTIYYGSTAWWIDTAKLFQDGDALQVLIAPNNQKYIGYATTDASKQIVKYVAIQETAGTAIIKVAKLNNDIPQNLTNNELTRFAAYVQKQQPIGTNIAVSSLPADKLLLNLSIYIDAIYEQSSVAIEVNSALANYLKNITFGGVVELIRLIDAIQQVPAVKDVVVTSAQGRSDAGTYTTFTRVYSTFAGYIQLDNDSVITYLN